MRALILRIAAAFSLLLVLLGWSVASPLASSPDDDYHLASIWCSEFSYEYPCTAVPVENGGVSVVVPAVVIESHVCYAFQPLATANCVDLVEDTMRLTDRINQVQGLYPGGFYTAMSLFASNDYTASVFTMRMVNALIVAVLLGAFLIIGRPYLQRSALLVLPVMFVPVALFLFASTNPSSWTIAGSLFFFLFGMNAVSRGASHRIRYVSLALAIISAVLAMSSRVDASAFIFLIAIVVVVLARRTALVEFKSSSIGLVLTGVVALGYFFVQGLGPAGSSTTIGESKYVGGLFFTNILEIPGFLGGAVGAAPLGWLDTRMPGLVATVGLLMVGGLVFWGLAVMDRRKAIATAFLALAAFGVPVVLAQQQRIEVLDFVQARYLLPLLLVLVIVIVTTYPPIVRERFPVVPHAVMATMVGLSGMAALWATYHRFAFSEEIPFFARELEPKWTGLLGAGSFVSLLIGIAATTIFAAVMMATYRSVPDPEETTTVREMETT